MKASLSLFSKYPRGYLAAYLTVFFGNFTFYGLRVILMIYLTKTLLLSDGRSFTLYSTFMALAYLTPILGGFLADKFIGNRLSVVVGGVLISLGCSVLGSFGGAFYLAGLSLVILGTGFFKPNIVSTVGLLFTNQNDPLKDRAYTTFYTGMNLGTFVTSVFCGWVGETWGWGYVFPLIASVMALGTILFYLDGKNLVQPLEKREKIGCKALLSGLGFILSFAAIYLFLNLENNAWLLPTIIGSAVGLMGYAFANCKPEERAGLVRLSILMVFFSFFCSLFEQTGSSITLFIEREVDRSFCPHFSLPTPFFQSLIPGFVLFLTPVVNRLWQNLEQRRRPISVFSKFAWGFLGVSASFWILVLAIYLTPSDQEIKPFWIVLNYAFHVVGDLCIVPLGFAAVSKESPRRFSNMMMGIWMVCIACGHFVAGWLARGAAFPRQVTSITEGRLIYLDFFTQIAIAPFVVALLIFLVRVLIRNSRLKKHKFEERENPL